MSPRFSAADLTVAAQAAPVVFPAECRAVLPRLEEIPAAMRVEVDRFRGTEAGRFALRMYAQEHAGVPPAGTDPAAGQGARCG